MILDEMKKANIEALKAKDEVARNFYSVILNKVKLEEIKKREKSETLVDADIIQILQKTMKELDDEQENYKKVNNTKEIANLDIQKKIASSYLPQMMTKEEIKQIIEKLEDKSIGNVMKHFKMNYAGKVDMRDVSEVQKGL